MNSAMAMACTMAATAVTAAAVAERLARDLTSSAIWLTAGGCRVP